MAYFSNGSAGMDFQSKYCAKCSNAEEDGMCVIWDIHMFYNYDQLSKGQEKLKSTLNMLINDETNVCSFFKANQIQQ